MDFYEYLKYNAEPLFHEAVEHIQLVAIAIGIALVLGGALGVLAHRSVRVRPAILAVSSTLLTIPSLALFALAIPLLGLGTPPTVAALVLYALLPIVRNTAVQFFLRARKPGGFSPQMVIPPPNRRMEQPSVK